MNLYVLRHGTTVWNEKGITQGRSQNRLSKSGCKLVERVAKDFANTKIDLIVSSPLMRTIQTSNIINKYHNVKIIKDEAITEMDQGIFTAKKYKTLTDLEKKQKHERSKITKMESFEHGYNRALDFVNKIKSEYKNKDILVVTHNNIASFIELIALNKKVDFNNREQMSNFKNAELKHFTI